MLQGNRGFTLVEMIVVMAVFMVVIIISGDTFNRILSLSTGLIRSEESSIEGIVGLEMLRHDLQQAGYGLFTEELSGDMTAYKEAAAVPARLFNEACLAGDCTGDRRIPPRPLAFGENLAATAETSSGATYNVLKDTDYVVIKGMSVARSLASQKWTYLQYVAGTGGVPHLWPSDAENLKSNDRVVLMRRAVTPARNTLTVVPDGFNDFYHAYSQAAFEQYSSATGDYFVYGLDNSGTPSMPFNRTDYFVARPATTGQIPALCAPSTGILYKTTVNQANGKLTYLPVLDCVADMQVVLGWDLMDSDGTVDTWSNADGTRTSGPGDVIAALSDPAQMRASLKVIKVFILAQVGRKDPGYRSPDPGTIDLSEPPDVPNTLGKTYALEESQRNYRWKVYRLTVRPRNLLSNQ